MRVDDPRMADLAFLRIGKFYRCVKRRYGDNRLPVMDRRELIMFVRREAKTKGSSLLVWVEDELTIERRIARGTVRDRLR